MEDKSLYNSQVSKISDGLQNFIDSMVEEIVLEGKPFDTQKKYLKKYSENDGIEFSKLETDLTTFIDIIGNLKLSFNKYLVKFAEDKARECYISDNVVKRVIDFLSQQNNESNTSRHMTQIKKKWMMMPSFIRNIVALLLCTIICTIIGTGIGAISSLIHYYMYGGDVMNVEIISFGFIWGILGGVVIFAIIILRGRRTPSKKSR